MASKKRNRRIIIIAAIVVIIILIVAAMGKKKEHAIKVSTEYASRRNIVESVSANGKIQPEVDVKISPYISGEVVELYVKEGDQVSEGDLLAKIDPEIYKTNYERMEASLQMQYAQLSNAKARLAQSNAQFVKAKEDYNRNEKLYDQKVISEAEFDAAVSAFEVAKQEVVAAEENVNSAQFSVNSAKASLQEANENLTRTAIYAPTNGTVSALSVEKGERVTGASQFSAGTEIMRIANLDSLVVNVEVNENDIVRVDLGDTCIIEVDAYLGEKFKGVVLEKATSANTTGVSADQITNFDVKILILKDSYQFLVNEEDNISSPFRPGMSATVDIQTDAVYDVISVPIQSVTTRADTTSNNEKGGELLDNEKEVVFIIEESKATLRFITTGIQDRQYIEVTEGLADSIEIITGPFRMVSKILKGGEEVKIVDQKELFESE